MKYVSSVTLCAFVALSTSLHAQTGIDVWHEDGQTWIKWTDNQTFSGAETWSIYRASAPITDLSQAQLVAKSYPQEVHGSFLRAANPTATWVVPDPASAGTITLTSSEALFVYTPRAAIAEYFAVVKTGQTALGPDNTFGPVTQTVNPVTPHAQFTGVDAGHPFTLYSLWIDGDADLNAGRPDYPILGGESFRGTARLFCVFEPTIGLPPAPMPMVGFLHGGDGNYWTYRPSQSASHQIDLHVENGLYVTFDDRHWIRPAPPFVDEPFDFRSRWFGFVQSFDRFEPASVTPPADAIVTDTTHRFFDWILDWLVTARGVDANRISLAGLSMGGRGTSMYTRARPQRLSSALMFVPPVTQDIQFGWDAMFGAPTQNLTTSLGVHYDDLIRLDTPLSTLDLPYARVISGTSDDKVGWIGVPSAYRGIDDDHWGWSLYWDEREHTNNANGWIGAHFNGSPRLRVEPLTGRQLARSFPAFLDVDHSVGTPGTQPDPGDDVLPANGTPWGTWGGYFDWSDASLIDTASSWSVEAWVVSASTFANDIPPTASASCSIGVRRAQNFHPAPCSNVDWRLVRVANGVVLASGTVVVSVDGHVVVPNLLLTTSAARLELQPGAAFVDCNGNGVADACDIANATSLDTNADGVPDECQPVPTPVCFGDGSGTACPCANVGASGHGCANSADSQGALLTSSGVARVSADNFVLQGSHMPGTSTALYFQGLVALNGGLGVAFGDGLRCVGGSAVRLSIKVNVAGASQYPTGADLSVSVRGSLPIVGGLRHYQCWYRDAAPTFCAAATFNLTNALSVPWAP